jgi:Zn-dependent protease
MKDIVSPLSDSTVPPLEPLPSGQAQTVPASPPEPVAQSAIMRGGLLAFAAVKFSKLALTVGTMLLSIWAYSLVFGWPYAAGFVLLILVHEMGHFLAARQRGLDVGAPTFIPFIGAWIQLKDRPHNAEMEAYVGLAGPLAGTFGASLCYLAGQYFHVPLLLALSYAGFFINLFNLVPLSPFDGGRVTAVLSPRVWLVGAPLLVAMFLWRPSPILIVMAILAAPQVMAAFRYDPRKPQNALYYATSAQTKLVYGAVYLGLVAFLALASYEVHNMLGAG